MEILEQIVGLRDKFGTGIGWISTTWTQEANQEKTNQAWRGQQYSGGRLREWWISTTFWVDRELGALGGIAEFHAGRTHKHLTLASAVISEA